MSLCSNLEKLPVSCWQNARVKISPIKTEAELIYAFFDCKVTDEQKEFVNPAWFSVGRAYLAPEDNYPCLIYNEKNEAIGFINFLNWLGGGDAYSWSFFIDMEQQGRGYGKASAKLAIEILKAANPKKRIKLSTERKNFTAQRIYLSLGFEKTSETDGDDLVFCL